MANTRIRLQSQRNEEVENKEDLQRLFLKIQQELENANSRTKLTESYRKAAYLMTLTHSPAWDNKFGSALADMREIAACEFASLARRANYIANKIGVVADYDDRWGNTH